MRILMLTQWFQPEEALKGLPFAKALARRGHEVEVLTGFPNYPSGKTYPGYKVRLFQREVIDGIRVNRTALYPSHDNSAIRRIANYSSFSVSSFFIGPWMIRKPDIIYVYNLVTLGPAALLMKRLFGAKLVYDVQDLWPESVAASGMLHHRLALNTLERYCNAIYRHADVVVAQSPGFKRLLVERGVSASRVEVIYNWCDPPLNCADRIPFHTKQQIHTSDRFLILYAGNIGRVQALDVVLKAAYQLQQENAGVEFVLIGAGTETERLRKEALNLGLTKVRILEPVSKAEIGRYLQQADALLVHLKDEPIFRVTIPSKTQAYLSAGKPILVGVKGDATELVLQAGAGCKFEPEQPSDLCKAAREMAKMDPKELRQMGQRGRQFYQTELDIEKGVDRFCSVFHDLLFVA
jgi:glycosyltransferase involved in cell wall biosynthesis